MTTRTETDRRTVRLTSADQAHVFHRLEAGVDGDDVTWQNRARCINLGVSVNVFFPHRAGRGGDKRGIWNQARHVCADCPVWADCLTWWIATTPPGGDRTAEAGFIGRTTPGERVELRRRFRAWRQGQPTPDDTTTEEPTG